jgi:hypothetical protein
VPEVHGHIAFPRNLAMVTTLTHALSAILHFGLSCGNERYALLGGGRHHAQKTDSFGCCKIAISLIDPVGSFSMREIAVIASLCSRATSLSDNVSMPMKIDVGETDDPYFIALLDSLLSGLKKRDAPEGFWIIQIDNWFDHKWLRFSGIGSVYFRFPAFMNRPDAALDEFYQDKVTFPPFTPNRVMAQWSYARVGDDYVEVPWQVPHQSERQSSEANLQRRVQDFGRSACFVWYSAKTVANGRGSVMVYNVTADGVKCWFAAFNRQETWKLHATKGVSRTEVEDLLRTTS